MKKSIKILICILIAIIICLQNITVYAKALEEYEVLEIINYCTSKEGKLVPEEMTTGILNKWKMRLDSYDKKEMISNYDEIANKAKIVMNTWIEQLRKMKTWGAVVITQYFVENNVSGNNSQPDVNLSNIDISILNAWFETLGRQGNSVGAISIGTMRTLIQEEIADRMEKIISKNSSPTEIAQYFLQKNNDLSEVNTAILYAWYNTISSRRYELGYTRSDEIRGYIRQELENRDIDLDNYRPYDFEDIEEEADLDYWKPTSESNTELADIASKMLGIIQVVGLIISVIALVLIGIKYMLGSVSEKAKYKEVMIPYIVGCVMLFAITNIASIIYKVAINL